MWRIKVRPFSTVLKRYLTALENIKGLTEGEIRETGVAVRTITGLKQQVEDAYIKFIQDIKNLDQSAVIKGLNDA